MNRQVRFRGHLDVPLDEQGRREAREAAVSLQDKGIRYVYSSPLGRAREVAMEISQACGVDDIVDLPDLINLDYGEWEGLTKLECASRDPEAWSLYADDPDRATCPGGESVDAAADRIMNALRELGERHPGASVAAVSHGVMLRLAVRRTVGSPPSGWQFKVPTGSALEFAVDEAGVRLLTPLADAPVDPHKDPTIRGATGLREAG